MQTSIKKVTNEDEQWKNVLAFYKDELMVFRNRLNEVAASNNTNPILEKIEHFQNQFDIHDTKISELKHEIDQYIHRVYNDSQAKGNHITSETAALFEDLKSKVMVSSKLFDELKYEFKHFLFLEKVL